MTPETDSDLLRQFAQYQSDTAFAGLVERHVSLVYSVALRQAGDPHHAEEITQAVFIILAKKAGTLQHERALTSWLFQTTRLTANNFLRGEFRRRAREQEAYMQSTLNEPAEDAWRRIAPMLDEAVSALGEADRRAVLLRFYEGRNLREVGAALYTSEDAAKKRVNRAVDKMRKFFAKRGVMLTVTLIAGAVSANSVQAAPLMLTKTVTAVAISKGSIASASTLTLVKGAMKLMTWLKIKTAVAIAVAVVFTAVTTIVVTRVAAQSAGNPSVVDDSAWDKMDSRSVDALPPAFVLRLTHFSDGGSGAVTTSSQKMLGRSISFETLMSLAYGERQKKIIFPADEPVDHYDLLLTDPKITAGMLQGKIKQQLGYTAHREVREAEVYRLEVKQTSAPGLRPSQAGKAGGGMAGSGGSGGQSLRTIRNKMSNTSFPVLVMNLQGYLNRPLIDHTGLTGNYDMDLKVVVKPGDSDTKALIDALPAQLGLELVPANENISTLVVEKAN